MLNIKEERERLGMTQTEFAKLLGVSRKTVVNYESGGNIPETKEKLYASILGNITHQKEKGYTSEEINKQLEETKQEYKTLTTQFRKTGKDLIDLSLEVVDNWDELKKLKHIQNLIKLDVLEAERQENIKR